MFCYHNAHVLSAFRSVICVL